MASEDKPRRGGWLARWRAPQKREKQLATLQEGFSELVDLTRSIREHMDQQARTQQTLLDMMQHIPGAVDGLKNVGKASEQQTETLALLKRQLEAAARNEDHLVESMRSFNKTLALMDDMSKRTSQTVSSMAERTRDSEDLLRNILERSERRLVWMIVTLMVVTLAVLGVGLYFGLGARPTTVTVDPAEVPVPIESFEHLKSITDLEEEADPVVPDDAEPVEDEVEEEAIEPEEDEEIVPEEPEIDADPEAAPVDIERTPAGEVVPEPEEMEAILEEDAELDLPDATPAEEEKQDEVDVDPALIDEDKALEEEPEADPAEEAPADLEKDADPEEDADPVEDDSESDEDAESDEEPESDDEEPAAEKPETE